MNTSVVNSSGCTQHFYLRLKARKVDKLSAAGAKTAPVGILAFKLEPTGYVRVAGSMVSCSDTFRKTEGVVKAYGRLRSDKHSVQLLLASFRQVQASQLASMVGLLHPEGKNQFSLVDWETADATKSTALQSLMSRLTSQEAPAG